MVVQFAIIFGGLLIVLIGLLVFVEVTDEKSADPGISLIDIVHLKMSELKISKKELAHILNIPDSQMIDFLSGKKEIDFDIAKGLYCELEIDAKLIFK